MSYVETPIDSRYLSQDDRIEIADGLARREPVEAIAARIGKTHQSVYREIARNRKPDGRYQPWFAHNQAHLRRRRSKAHKFETDPELRRVVADKLARRWSPGQISRWRRHRWPRRGHWHVCHETIYEAIYQGLIVVTDRQTLRTGRLYRHRRGRGRNRQGALRQSTNLRSIHERPASVESRRRIGHWEGDLIVGAGQRSAIATLVERKTRHTILVPLRGGHLELAQRLVAQAKAEGVSSATPCPNRRPPPRRPADQGPVAVDELLERCHRLELPLLATCAEVLGPSDQQRWDRLLNASLRRAATNLDQARRLRDLLARHQRFLIVLDGLDEAAVVETDAIGEFIDTHPGTVRVVITSRPGSWGPRPPAPSRPRPPPTRAPSNPLLAATVTSP